MKNLQGYRPPIHNWNFLLKLQKIGDLVHFQGPLLSLFKDENNRPYIYNWANSDKQYNRWLVFETSVKDLDAYLQGEKNLLAVIMNCKNDSVYIIDLDNDIQYHNVTILNKNEIPKDYLPNIDFYHEDEDCSHLAEIQRFIQCELEKEQVHRKQRWLQRFKSLSQNLSANVLQKQSELYQKPQLTQIPA